jgi:hypothetical protein
VTRWANAGEDHRVETHQRSLGTAGRTRTRARFVFCSEVLLHLSDAPSASGMTLQDSSTTSKKQHWQEKQCLVCERLVAATLLPSSAVREVRVGSVYSHAVLPHHQHGTDTYCSLDLIIPFILSSFPNFSSKMTVKEQIVHDRVNLVRLMRRLDKSVNEADWGTERSWTIWLKSERVLQVGSMSARPSTRNSMYSS